MNPAELQEAVIGIAKSKGVEQDLIVDILKEVVSDKVSEYYNLPDTFIKVDITDTFDLNVQFIKEVVKEVEDKELEISELDAQQIDKDSKLGDTLNVPIEFNSIGRKNVKQLMMQFMGRIQNLHKEVLYREFKEREGNLINGAVLRKSGNVIFIDLGKAEGILLKRDQSPREFYRQGDKIRAYLREVVLDENNKLNIYLSRTDPEFIKKLFELEVPEIADGIIKIRKIIRDPGIKIKMSVISTKSEVEPVGACVGMNGVRIKAIIKEINGEKIDVIPFNQNIKDFVTRAMQPAKVTRVLIVNEEEHEILVVVDDTQYSLAIGKNGMNVRLASKLTDWKIDVKTEKQIEKHPEFLQIFSKADELFSVKPESDLYQLSEINEELLVKLMNNDIVNIYQLYEMSEKDIAKVDGITKEDAEIIKKTLNEVVEIVDNEEELASAQEAYESEFEDEIAGVNVDEKLEEEIQEVEYLTCPSCEYEFKYIDQNQCPKCGVEFEFEEEIIEE